MQAIIMAGGEGTRLRPMTCDLPKPLAPLCGKPVLMYILELLQTYSFDKATLTLMYKADRIMDTFEDDKYEDISLDYSIEKDPLGTAGCVKLASYDDEVLVISGDAMCDFNLAEAIKFHRQKKADATIIVKKVIDPREFGLVLNDKEGKITGFIEKPSYESCTTDLANTGVYILSKSALDMIEPDKKKDFAGDIFPLMLKNSMNIYAYEEKGYWCDIGDFKSYLRCQQDMLEGKVTCRIDGHRQLDSIYTSSTSLHYNGVKIIPPVFIGKNVRIGQGTIIDSGTVLCDDVVIGSNCRIHSCVIQEDAFLGDRVSCNEAVICNNAKLLRECTIEENAVVGENAIIGENATVSGGVKIWSNKSIERNFKAVYDIKYGSGRELFIDDEGICGETNGNVNPRVAMLFGSSLATCSENNIVAVGRKSGIASEAMSMAFCSGAMSSGVEVWDFGECTQPEMDYCMVATGITSGAYIESGEVTKLRAISEFGLLPTRKQERKIEAGINRSEYAKASFNEFGNYKKANDIVALYKKHIESLCTDEFKGFYIQVKSADERALELLSQIVFKRNDYDGQKIIINLTSGGRLATFYSEDTGYVFYQKLIMLCCLIYFKNGKDVSLPYHFPSVADTLAQAYGRKVLRYYSCSCDNSDKEARKLAQSTAFVHDGIALCTLILSYISDNKITLKQALSEIPEFYTTAKYVSIHKSPSQVLKEICPERSGLTEGVAINDEKGRVLIRPVKAGRGVMMFVESFKSETATELCNDFEKIIRDNENI